MKDRSGMPYDVVAFSTDERAMLLTLEEEGAYHRLLRHSWVNGGIPDDIGQIAQICRCAELDQFRKLWKALKPFWPRDPLDKSRRVNPKQESEREFKQEKSGKAKVSAAKRWQLEREAKALQSSNANAMRTHTETQCEGNAPLPSPPLPKYLPSVNTPDKTLLEFFESLWNNYPRPKGKKAALRSFSSSVKDEQAMDEITLALNNYRNHCQNLEPRFIQNGSTWFNGWRDWIMPDVTIKTVKPDAIPSFERPSVEAIQQAEDSMLHEYRQAMGAK